MRSWALAAVAGALADPAGPEIMHGVTALHASFADEAGTREVHRDATVEGSKFFEHARLSISDRGAQAAVLAQSVVDMLDEDKRRLVVEKMESRQRQQLHHLEVAAASEAQAEAQAREVDPDSFVIAPSVVSMHVQALLPALERQHAAAHSANPQLEDEQPYTVTWNDYLAVFGGFGLLTLFFGARVASGLDDPILIAKELIVVTSLYMLACTAYLGAYVGSECVWSLLQCCIADLLMGFDNLLDLSGWYSNTNISFRKVTMLLVVGGFIQLNLRFALSIGVHFLTGQVDSLSRLAGGLVVLCGLRTLWFSSSLEQQASEDVGKLKRGRGKAATFWDMLGRAAIVEVTDALGSMDSLCGKLVNTRDLLVINASSLVGVFFVRALSIVLLLNVVKKQTQELDRFSLPTEVFLPFVGILLLAIGFHGIFPSNVPAIPPAANVAIACTIYGYLTFRLFALSSRRERREASRASQDGFLDG